MIYSLFVLYIRYMYDRLREQPIFICRGKLFTGDDFLNNLGGAFSGINLGGN